MTPAAAREIDRLEFEAECAAIRQRAHEIVQAHEAEAKALADALAKLELPCAAKQTNPEVHRPNPFNGPHFTKAKTYSHDGLTLTLSQWSERLGVPHARLANRLRSGWPLAQVLTTDNHRGKGAPDSSNRRAKTYTHNGATMTLSQWAASLGLSRDALYDRMQRGWPLDRVLSARKHSTKHVTTRTNRPCRTAKTYALGDLTLTLSQWSQRLGISRRTLSSRMERGWSIEQMLTGPMHSRGSKHRGVVRNFGRIEGTGAGSTAQEMS